MSVVLASARPKRLRIAAILISALAVMAMMTGCPPDSGSPSEYTVTILSTAGGIVTTPGEGTFGYAAGTTVELVATPNAGYEFRGWTGDTGRIAERRSASTTVKVQGNYSITATFGTEGGGGEEPSPYPHAPY